MEEEKHRESVRKWRERNPDYYKKNIEKMREKARKWRDKNREKKRHYTKLEKVQRKGAIGSHTLGEWELLKKQYGYTCPCCGRKEPEIKLTEDHIIPLSKGGSNYIENIQPLCRSCNSKKHTKTEKFLGNEKG